MKKILLILVISFSYSSFSQEHVEHEHNHSNEFSFAIGVIPQHEYSIGIHAHYIKGVALENKLGFGVSVETILDEHAHHSFSLISLYRFGNGITLAYASGMLRVAEENNVEFQFAQHFELGYEIAVGEFHVGPQLDVGIEEEGVHYLLGLHLGIDF